MVDDDALIPRWVSYVLTRDHTLGCGRRSNDFHPDNQLPADHRASPSDYARSGYDRGHQAPAEDFAWDRAEEHDSFSMANMAPQLPGLNRRGWEGLEDAVRAWAWERGTLVVMVGPVIPHEPERIGKNGVVVPSAFWKVLIDPARHEISGFEMPQANVPKGHLEGWLRPVSDIERDADIRLPVHAGLAGKGISPLWPADDRGWRQAHEMACAPR